MWCYNPLVFLYQQKPTKQRILKYLGICYSYSIVSPTSFLPTSRIIGFSQPSEMRRCSYFSTLMRTIISIRYLNARLQSLYYKNLSKSCILFADSIQALDKTFAGLVYGHQCNYSNNYIQWSVIHRIYSIHEVIAKP